MRLKILLPTEIFLDREVDKIVAEAVDGAFCLLPRHIDCVAPLVPGIFSYEAGGGEVFLAVDEGILVKQDGEVLVSCRDAVKGPELGRLRRVVEEKFMVLDEQEKKSRSVVARIEAGFVRKFLDIQRHG